MPDMDGISFLKEVRSINTNIPFIIFTAFGDESTVIDALNNGADFYLKKNYDILIQFFELIQIVKMLVARVHSEELLRKSEEKFRTIAECSNDWVYWINPHGSMVYISPSCERITGYNQEEFYLDPGLRDRIVFLEDITVWDTYKITCSNERIPISLDFRIIHKNGSIRWVRHTCQQVFGSNGQYVGLVANILDISSLKDIEAQVLCERNNFLEIFRASPVGLLLINKDTEITKANDAFSTMVLHEPADIIRKRAGGGLFCVHSLEDPRGCGYSSSCPACPLRNGIEAVIRDKTRIHDGIIALNLVIRGTPEQRWLKINAEPVDIEGEGYVIVAIDDITKLCQIDDALRESEERYRSLFENMLEGYVYCQMLYDTKGNPNDCICLDVNDAFGQLTGLKEVKGKLISEVVPDVMEETPELFDICNSVVVTGEPTKFEINFTPLHIWLQISVFRPKEGHFVAVFENITERKLANEALVSINHKLNLLSNIIRHDIGNELQVMLGYLEIIGYNELDPKLQEHIRRINISAQNIGQLLAFSKDYQNIGVKVPIWQDVKSAITRIVNSMGSTSIRIEIDIFGVEIYADPLVEKVYYNLIENACRHGEKISQIRFYGREDVGGYVIVCEDDGIGIPDEYKKKIFNREYFKHTGFGLNLSREILDITGITIQETGTPGTGAKFEILVPRGKYRFIGLGE